MNSPTETNPAQPSVRALCEAVAAWQKEVVRQCAQHQGPPSDEEAATLQVLMTGIGTALREVWRHAYADPKRVPNRTRRVITAVVFDAMLREPAVFDRMMLPCITDECEEFVPYAVPTLRCPACSRNVS